MNPIESLSDPNAFNESKDTLLNKTVFDMFSHSLFGAVTGLGLCLLFKNKARACIVAAGFGAGVSYEKNNGDLIRNLFWWRDSHKI